MQPSAKCFGLFDKLILLGAGAGAPLDHNTDSTDDGQLATTHVATYNICNVHLAWGPHELAHQPCRRMRLEQRAFVRACTSARACPRARAFGLCVCLYVHVLRVPHSLRMQAVFASRAVWQTRCRSPHQSVRRAFAAACVCAVADNRTGMAGYQRARFAC